jgi:4-amino-4-deoxy-L-arabinose transferase-like glycosyltransferase
MGTQISWLIPAALLLGAAALLCTLGAGRADRTRAGVVLWGGWLLVTGIAFSFGHGIIHPYYTSALGPALGALVGIGGWSLWTRRSNRWARAALAVTLGVTAGWSAVLLRRTPSWNPVLVPIVVITGLAVGAAMLVGPLRRGRWASALASAAVVVALVGPGAYTLATAATPHEGAIPTAGPTIKTPPRLPLLPVVAPAAALASQRASQRLSQRLGGLLNISLPRNTLRDHLLAGRPRSRWILAVARSEVAAGYQLATRRPVLAIGGFNGTDPFPTLRQFVAMVQRGEIRWFIATRPGRIPGRNKPANQISRWVIEHFTRERVGGVWIYDLTRPAPS